MVRDDAFEELLEDYRRKGRTRVAKSIHFKAPREEFEAVCRGKLEDPESVTFFWRTPDKPLESSISRERLVRYLLRCSFNKHTGYAFLAFENASKFNDARRLLQNLSCRGHDVIVLEASRIAVSEVMSHCLDILANMKSEASTQWSPCCPPHRRSTHFSRRSKRRRYYRRSSSHHSNRCCYYRHSGSHNCCSCYVVLLLHYLRFLLWYPCHHHHQAHHSFRRQSGQECRCQCSFPG